MSARETPLPISTSRSACPVPAGPPLGVIEEVHGPVIDILCTRLPALHQAVYVCLDGERYIFEVHRHLDESRARAIALHGTGGLRRLMPVFDTGAPFGLILGPDSPSVDEPCGGTLGFSGHWILTNVWVTQADILASASSTAARAVASP